jgi:hypothetical protein
MLKKKIGLLITSFVLSFIVLLVTGECILTNVGLGDPIIYYSDPAFGYSLEPNQQVERLRDSTVTINESGLRSLQSWENIDQDKILFLGDSITYGGSYITDDDIFTSLICKKMTDYVCGNAGVNGYGVLNMVMRSRFDTTLDDANIVVFTVAPGDFKRGLTTINHLPYFVGSPSGLFVNLFPAISETVNFASYKFHIGNSISKSNNHEGWNPPDHFHQSAKFALEILNVEVERLQSQGKEVFVFLSPQKNDPNFKDELAKVIDDTLMIFYGENYMRGDFLNRDEYFYDSVHYEILGHAEVANKMIEMLSRQILK